MSPLLYLPEGYTDNSQVIVHELSHQIGFLTDEYDSLSLYLGGDNIHPNIDSFSCKKWCNGVDVNTECYKKYVSWINCFNKEFISQIPEMQQTLTNSNLDPIQGYDWWGVCFDELNFFKCGMQMRAALHAKLFNDANKDDWNNKWQNCRNLFTDNCNLGFQCQNNQGCFTRDGFATFTPSIGSIMESAYTLNGTLNDVSKKALVKQFKEKNKIIEIKVLF